MQKFHAACKPGQTLATGVQTASHALDILDSPNPPAVSSTLRQQLQERLALYRQHKPYRE